MTMDWVYRFRRVRHLQLAAEWDGAQARGFYEAGAYESAVREQQLQAHCAQTAREWMEIDEEVSP